MSYERGAGEADNYVVVWAGHLQGGQVKGVNVLAKEL